MLEYINPSSCTYDEWISVGMALKHEGYSVADWDSWSRDDPRYHPGECESKWNSFEEETTAIVTGGTIFEMATRNGWVPKRKRDSSDDRVLEWDDTIGVIVDSDSAGRASFSEPKIFEPSREIIRYLSALFSSEEYVGYVTESMEKDSGKYVPANSGSYDRTAGQLIQGLQKCNGDIGAVLGDYNANAGAWIRFNPLNGKGVRNTDIEDFRYALVESDAIDPERQLSIMKQLELPIAVAVFSGSKSIHAIVRVEAESSREYRERVDYLYRICDKNGLKVDRQNKNPSRLSRLPGAVRGERKQFIIDTNIGKASWNEWVEWIESINDDLPDPESLADVFYSPPQLAEELIEGVLRQGHKMLLVGPSKSGKSFSLIELCIAIAEGREWLGKKCRKGKVMYINMELDRPSCIRRFVDVYRATGIEPKALSDITIWNLRGKAPELDKLVPKIIRRSEKIDYRAIVIDPIYKVITGDENSASEMARFCNQFDRIASSLGASVIYAHHHSKGAQAGKKSMDRASGSGVFARDPDALIDMLELPIPKEARKKMIIDEKLRCYQHMLDTFIPTWKVYIEKTLKTSSDDLETVTDYAEDMLSFEQMEMLNGHLAERIESIGYATALQVSGTLREFQTFRPFNIFFSYPIHRLDSEGYLDGVRPESSNPFERMGETQKKKKDQNIELFLNAFDELAVDNEVTIKDLADSGLMMGKTAGALRNSIPRWIKNGDLEGFAYAKGKIKKV